MYVDISLNRISTLHYLMYFCNAQKRQLGRLFTAIAPILIAETVLAIKYNISMALAKRIVAKRQSLDTCCFLIWLHQEICTETDKCGFFLAFIMFLLITRMLVNDWYLLNFFPSRFYFTLEYIYILHMPQNLWSVIIFFSEKFAKQCEGNLKFDTTKVCFGVIATLEGVKMDPLFVVSNVVQNASKCGSFS